MGQDFVTVKGKKHNVISNALDFSGLELKDMSDIKGLEVLTGLKELYLNNNEMEEIKELERLDDPKY